MATMVADKNSCIPLAWAEGTHQYPQRRPDHDEWVIKEASVLGEYYGVCIASETCNQGHSSIQTPGTGRQVLKSHFIDARYQDPKVLTGKIPVPVPVLP